jgi:hypothetical protein
LKLDDCPSRLSIERKTPSAIGERQILPKQTNNIEVGVM